jgi:hypothetical protein
MTWNCLFLCHLAVASALAFASASARAATRSPDFTPFLEAHCFDCHDEQKQKGGLRLDTLGRNLEDAANSKHWQDVYERVSAGEMPPKRKTQPAPNERAAFTESLKQSLLAADQLRRADGRVVARRLNRDEYQNTVRDLFGIDAELKDLLPEDAGAQGFDNIGEALSTSTVLLERYLETADLALDAALVKGPAPEPKKWHVTLKPMNLKAEDYRVRSGLRILPDETCVFFHSGAYQPVTLEQFRAPVEGRYRFRICHSAYQSAGQPLTVAWYGGSFDKKSVAAHLLGCFDLPAGEPTITEFIEKMPAKGTLKPIPYRFKAKGMVDSTGYDGPGIAVHWVDIEGPLIEAWPPAGVQRMLGAVDLAGGTLDDAEKVLRNFAPRAFRRPVTDEDITPYLALVRTALDEKKPLEQALRDGLKGMLCSPSFLFLREKAGPLDDFALASRLSYFLWSSLPDEALFAAAGAGQLRGTLHEQVERMLADPKAERFITNFTGQWLGLRKIDATTPDKRFYPEFDDGLKLAMVKETQLFFRELLDHDLSVRNFVHSDFSLLNSRLAELYRIPGVQGQQFRKTTLPADAHRGGLLGQAAILKITANGTTTSPVIRGNWVLGNLLGRPTPPPPADVPAIEPDIRGATTIREQVAKHRAQESCAVCHDRIDPLGLALENFDVIGQWRTQYRVARLSTSKDGEVRATGFQPGPAVDASAALAGEAFTDVDALKKLLLAQPRLIARCLAEKLLIYATGAPVTFADRVMLDDLVKTTPTDGLRTILHAVVQSPSFLNK